LTASGIIAPDSAVVAVLTGNLLKDPDYIYKYHTGQLTTPAGDKIMSNFGNQPVVVPNDPEYIGRLLA
jgi:threonine synthase